MSWYQTDQEAKEATAKAKAAILAHALKWKAQGIERVVCEYDGTGDEGYIQGYSFDDDEITNADASVPDEVNDAFDELTFAHVSYDNEGGGGTITVDMSGDEIKITREEYAYETERVPTGPEEIETL